MKVIDTKINGVKIIEPKVFEDVRGFFLETFNAQRYKKMLDIEHDFIQITIHVQSKMFYAAYISRPIIHKAS